MSEELIFEIAIEELFGLIKYLIAFFVLKKLIIKDVLSSLCNVCKRYTPQDHRKILKDMDARINKRKNG